MRGNSERKRDERSRMRAAGYVLKQFWVHRADWQMVKKYLLRISRRRENK